MVNTFEFIINIFEELIITTFLMLYFGNKYSDFRKYVGFIATVVISVATITFFNSMYIYEGFLVLFFFVDICCIFACFFEGR